MRILPSVAAVLLATALSLPGQAVPAPPAILQDLRVTDAGLQSLLVTVERDGPLVFTIWLDGAPCTVRCERRSLRAPGFVLLEDGPAGLQPVTPPPPATWRGSVDGYPGSVVALTLAAGSVTGIVRLDPGLEPLGIQPARTWIPGAAADLHIVYDARHTMPGPEVCSTPFDPALLTAPLGTRQGQGNLMVCDIALDCDYHFYQDNGSNMANTVMDAETVMNATDAIYVADVGITYSITTIVVRSSSATNPYSTSNPSSLLNQFSSQWLTNHANVPRDIAHLMTGRNLSGSTIGVAYVGVICNIGSGYGLSERYTSNLTRRTGLTAHELGHNWGAGHCSGSTCWIMCPSINGCGGNVTAFSQVSINAILAHKATRSCLTPAVPPPPPPPPTWSLLREPRRLNPSGQNPGDDAEGLSIAMAGPLVVAAWSERGGSAANPRDIFAAVSHDEGLTFAPMVRVDTGDAAHGTDSHRPVVAISAGGVLLCAWEDVRLAAAAGGTLPDLLFSRSIDGGMTWSAPVPLNGPTAGFHATSSVSSLRMVATGSDVHVCWLEDALSAPSQARELRYCRSQDAGGTWSLPVVLNPQVPGHTNGLWPHNDAGPPDLAADGARVVIAYADDRVVLGGVNQDDVYVLVSTDRGANFTETAVEGSTAGAASVPRVALSATDVIVCFSDDEGTPGSTVRGVWSSDGGASFSPETTLSPAASSTPGCTVRDVGVAASPGTFVVTWCDDHAYLAAGSPSTMALFKAFASVSVNTGQSFILGSDLDLDATRENARPQPVVTNRMAYVAMELGPEGSNALGFSTSQNKGVTWAGPHLLDGTGPDADVPSSARTFVTDPSHDIACFVYFDSTTGDNEPFATAVRLPYVLVDGVTTPSNPVRFALLGVPSSLSAGSQFVVLLSTSGTSPALAVPGLPLLHLVPDALTYFLLGDPTFIPLTSGPLTIFGAGFSLPFPWPFGSGAPDLDAIAVIIDASGQIIQVTDPVHIVSE